MSNLNDDLLSEGNEIAFEVILSTNVSHDPLVKDLRDTAAIKFQRLGPEHSAIGIDVQDYLAENESSAKEFIKIARILIDGFKTVLAFSSDAISLNILRNDEWLRHAFANPGLSLHALMFWGNGFFPIIERQKLLKAPAYHVENLKNGVLLIITPWWSIEVDTYEKVLHYFGFYTFSVIFGDSEPIIKYGTQTFPTINHFKVAFKKDVEELRKKNPYVCVRVFFPFLENDLRRHKRLLDEISTWIADDMGVDVVSLEQLEEAKP